MPKNRINTKRAKTALYTSLLMSSSLAVTLPLHVAAQSQNAQNTAIQFTIPAGPLGQALNEFAQQAGIAISFDASLVRGKSSSTFSASTTTEAGLNQLLSGSGLRSIKSASGYRIERETENAGPLVLGAIRVQGELIERTLQDTQTSVAVFSGDELEGRAEPDIFFAVERAPNVTQIGGDSGFSIRGIGQDGLGIGAGSTINVQVDGVTLPDSAAIGLTNFATWDVEQVEVLLGPQSTQQGRNALAGAVILRGNEPIYDNEYRFRVGFGGLDAQDGVGNLGEAAFSLNQVLKEDLIAVRIAGSWNFDQRDTTNVTTGDDSANEQTDWFLRGKVRFDPNEDLKISGLFSFSEFERGPVLVDDALFPSERVLLSDAPERSEGDQSIIGLNVTYDFNTVLSIESETSYYRDDSMFFGDFDRTPFPLGSANNDGDAESFEQEIRFVFEEDSYRGVLGFFYTDIETERNSSSRLDLGSILSLSPIPLPPIPPGTSVINRSINNQETQNWAIFGETELDADGLFHGLSFTLGFRYDKEEVESNTISTSEYDPQIPLPPLFTVNDLFLSASYDAFLPKVGLTYDWTSEISTSFTYQEGYRAGGSFISAFGEVTEFDPEFTKNYEFAFRGLFLEQRLKLNANLFYTDWTDQQVSIPDPLLPGAATIVTNAGESHLYGGELSVDYVVLDNLDVFVNLGMAKTQFDEYFVGSQDFSGNEFPRAPDTNLSFGATYDLAPAWQLGIDTSYTASAFSDSANSQEVMSDSRFLVNTQLTYKNESITAGLYARNLFNKDFATSRFLPRGGALPFGNLARPGQPLTVGIFVQVEY